MDDYSKVSHDVCQNELQNYSKLLSFGIDRSVFVRIFFFFSQLLLSFTYLNFLNDLLLYPADN